MDIESFTVKELKAELKSRGLKTSGNKAVLKERLTEAIAQSESQQSSDPVTTEEVDKIDSTIADFEDYINEEHKRMTANREKENEAQQESKPDEVNIDDIISKNNASIEAEEEKHQELLQTDFDLTVTTTTTPQQPSTVTISDFDTTSITTSTDPTALNNKDKVQERMNRFGTNPLSDSAKLESRKRRFAAMNGDGSTTTNGNGPDAKKQKIDKAAERKKIFDRAQKFGTSLPKNFKLSKEESEIIHKEKIERAKRFGTQHLLPQEIQKAEQDAKKAARMERFNTNDKGKIIGNDNNDEKPKNIIADKEKEGATKLMERKLRFGTMTDGDKQKQRQQRFGTGNKGDLSLDEMISNHKNNMKKKKFTPRQQKNNQRIQKFRQYKKNNKQFNNGNNNNNNQRGRGFGNNQSGGKAGRRGGNFGYRNNKQFNNNNNRRSGFRGNNNNGRGRFNNNNNKFNRGRQGGFNKNNGQHTSVQFSQADLQKIEARKQRFAAAIPDFL